MSDQASPPALARLTTAWSRVSPPTRQALYLGLAGLLVGLISVGFHYAVELLFEQGIVRAAGFSKPVFVLSSLGIVLSCSLLASWLIHRFSPESGGGGVMPTKLAFWKDFGFLRTRTAVIKFLGSALTLGGGVSMGPEGPSVQIGAATASSLATRLGISKQQHRVFCAAGAAAAIAAAFNAPLAAILFVLEEIISDLNSRLISGILLAAVMGALVTHALIGAQPAYQVAVLGQPTWKAIAFCVPVAAVASLAGLAFQKGAMSLRGRLRQASLPFPRWMIPCIGALLSWALAVSVFLLCGELGIFGIGYGDITKAIGGNLPWSSALLLLFGKLLATAFAVGAGGCGGIFAPSFFIGAMGGAACVGLVNLGLPLGSSDASLLVLVGMCACLGAVIRTPLTCILLIFEVTHEFTVIPFAILATLVSQLLARRLAHEGMYEQMLLQDGQAPETVLPPRDYNRWKQLHVGTLAHYQVSSTSDLRPEALKALLARSAFSRFPVLDGAGTVIGILRREEAESCIRNHTTPSLHKATWILPSDTLETAQHRLLDSTCDFLCVGEEASARIDGVLTLHDLLRAQQRLGDDASS